MIRPKLVAGDREGPILVRIGYCPDDRRLNSDDRTRFAVQGRAVQEPQQVLREGFRVHDVGDVLLSGQYQPLYIGVVVTAGG